MIMLWNILQLLHISRKKGSGALSFRITGVNQTISRLVALKSCGVETNADLHV